MRLVGSSDPDAVRRDGLRWHFEERAVLTSAVCRELESAGKHLASRRARAALDLLARWMRECVPSAWPARGEVNFRDGLDGPELVEVADDLRVELELGATVCADFMMLLTADTSFQAEGDSERLQRSLQAYSSHISSRVDGGATGS
jgi:hypothetical protein